MDVLFGYVVGFIFITGLSGILGFLLYVIFGPEPPPPVKQVADAFIQAFAKGTAILFGPLHRLGQERSAPPDANPPSMPPNNTPALPKRDD